MGVFRYGHNGVEFELADRVLAHMKLAIAVKLRRHEPFMLAVPVPVRADSLHVWISGGTAMTFWTASAAPTEINAGWVNALIHTADAGMMEILSEREAALHIAGIEMPADRRRGVHTTKHPKIGRRVRRSERR